MIGNTKGRKASVLTVLIAAVVGLVLGLAGGLIIHHVSKPSYTSSTTYSVAPAVATTAQQKAQSAQQLSQLGSVTPIASGRSTDTDIREKINQEIGRTTNAQIIPALIPDSPLLFQVQVKADSPKDAYDTAHALEKVLQEDRTTASVMDSSQARLIVVTKATEAAGDSSMPPVLIVGGSAIAGALVAAAIARLYLRPSTSRHGRK